MIHASDADIIGESRQRPERFAVIFDRYFAEVHRYIERRLGSDLADRVQDGPREPMRVLREGFGVLHRPGEDGR